MSEAVTALQLLQQEIANALGSGEFPEEKLRRFRWLWRTTPDSEKDGLSYTLKDIEEMVAAMRREFAIQAGAGKVRYLPIQHRRPGCGSEELFRCGY